MKSGELVTALAPFALIANKHALSPAYRSIALSAKLVRGCSSYALVELDIDMPFDKPPDADVYVDAESFIAVIKSLPDEEVKLSLTSGVIAWECSAAKGRLATAVVTDSPTLTRDTSGDIPYEPTDAFYQALDLGAMACTNVALTSAGLHGVVIDNRHDLAVIASDNISVSAAFCGATIAKAPDLMTFTPDALELLRCCIMYGNDVCQLTFNEKECNVVTGPMRASIKQVPPLKHDLRAIVAAYSGADVISPIPRDRIAAFLKRAAAIAEAKRMAVVTLGGSDGRLTLSFEEGSASSEEYYLVEDVKIPDIAPLMIESARLARALAHIDHVVLDHADRSVLVLRNIPASDDDVLFSYLLVGKK